MNFVSHFSTLKNQALHPDLYPDPDPNLDSFQNPGSGPGSAWNGCGSNTLPLGTPWIPDCQGPFSELEKLHYFSVLQNQISFVP